MSECKLNVILDLDNTIINAIETRDKIKVPLNTGLDYFDWPPMFKIYARPHLQEFLDFLFANFNVSVFTAADKDYAIDIVRNFIYKDHPERQLTVFFYRYHVEKSHSEYKGVKDLRILWDLFKVPGFYPCNTVIIDDLDMVAKTNSFNCIPIKAFHVVDDNGAYNPDAVNDTDLLRVKAKLQTVKQLYDTTVCSFYGYFTSGQDKQKPLLKIA
jgi:hypothetical protein